MNLKSSVAKLLSKELNIPEQDLLGLIEIPPQVSMGDFSFPCFSLTKSMKKSPVEISKSVSEKIVLKNKDVFLKVVPIGPYINFYVKPEALAESVINKKLNYAKKNEVIMVEFSQPNTHKEFHVGHLRNLCLGDSIVRINKSTGNKVIAVNYIGDIGTHVAKTLWCLKNKHSNDVLPKNKGKYLGQIYVEANKLIEGDQKIKEEVSKILQDLEERKPEITKLWKETREWSLNEFKEIYSDLDVNFDKYYFESEEDAPSKKIAKELLKNKIAEESEGAVIVNLESFDLGVAVILKSDGTTLYLTKDLSLGQKKFVDYNLDKSIYVVDSRQSMHLKQVFKILELMGFKKEMIHVSYEFVSTDKGPISSRTGNTYLYEDIKEKLVKKLVDETKKRHPDWDEKKVVQNANLIMKAALKFGMLKYDNNKEIIFSEDKWLDVEGETGPYVAYSYARVNSILKKVEKTKSKPNLSLLNTEEDKLLLRSIELSHEIILEAARNNKPSIIARHVLDLCQKSNEYYHKHQVLKAENNVKNARIVLLKKVAETIKEEMFLLGIQLPEEM